MKNLTNFLYLIAFLLLGSACHPKKETKPAESGPLAISVKDFTPDAVLKASTYFKRATVVPLETTERCLLTRLKKVVLYDDKLYVSDEKNKAGVFCFDLEGKLLRIIGNQGSGPHDHASLNDFSLDEESGLIYLNDRTRQRILVFTKDGEFVKSIALDTDCMKAEVCGGLLYLATTNYEAGKYDVEIKTLNGETTARYFPSLAGKSPVTPQLMKAHGNIYYYPNQSQDSFYCITKNGPSLLFYADYGKHAIGPAVWDQITDFEYSMNNPLWLTKYNNKYIAGFSTVLVFKDLIVFDFVFQANNGWKVFYEKTTGKTSVVLNFIDDLSYFGFVSLVSQTDHQLICARETPDIEFQIKSIRENLVAKKYVTPDEAQEGIARLKKLAARLPEESNPVVVIYDLK